MTPKAKQNNNGLILDAWRVKETQFNPSDQHHKETIFTIGNGYLSTRGGFEERYPRDSQATLIHGMWDDVPIFFTELANAPDWTSFEIWVNGQRFDMEEGSFLEYFRCLDLETGNLHRHLLWEPTEENIQVKLEFERFASLADQHIMALQVKITPMNSRADLRIKISLDSHVENTGMLHWDQVYQKSTKDQLDLVVKTRKSGKSLAMCARIRFAGGKPVPNPMDCAGCPGWEVLVDQNAGETLVIQKLVGIATSRDTDQPLKFAQNKVAQAWKNGFEAIKKAHLSSWKEFWNRCDVIIEGDLEAQTAIRHALFQLRIAAPTHDEYVSIGAKTLSGFGYRGHVFWDTEIFVLPFFTLTLPEISRNMLMYRYHTLPGARRKASSNGYRGAQYSWESAETGDEVTPPWIPVFNNPLNLVRIWTGDIELHISSDIVYAMHQYWEITGDDDFWVKVGIPVLLETAHFWADRVEKENGCYSIRDIIGPDEYHEHVDNNVFTNCMVQWHLGKVFEVLDWLSKSAPGCFQEIVDKYTLSEEKLKSWRRIHNNLVILQDTKTGLFEQFEGFFQLREVDWNDFNNRSKSMQELLGIEGANQYQVIKQADVVMLLCLRRDEFDQDTMKVNWNYYHPRTDHEFGSSLGPAFHAWAACEMEQPEEAYVHFMRAARADLLDVRGNAADGIHAASAGGLWQALAFGFVGLHFTNGHPFIKPQLPSNWKRLAFKIIYRGQVYAINITPLYGEIKETT